MTKGSKTAQNKKKQNQTEKKKTTPKHTDQQRELCHQKALKHIGCSATGAGAQLQGLPKGANCRSLWEPLTSPEAQKMTKKANLAHSWSPKTEGKGLQTSQIIKKG